LKLTLNHNALKAQHLSREKLGDDGFLIARDGPGVLVTGYTPRAALYGAFFVLEKATGFVDVRPQSGFAPIEPIQSATLKMELPFFDRPDFSERGASLSGMLWQTANENMLDWETRNGLSIYSLNTKNFVDVAPALEKRGLPLQVHGHSFAFLVPPGEFGKTHPEYFPLIDGKRKVADFGAQLCVSNLAVVDLVAQRLGEMIDRQPDLQVVGLGPNDGSGGWCECDQCRAMDSPLDAHQPFTHGERSYSTRYIKFANEVTQKLHQKHPAARVHVYAYTNYIAAPDCPIDPALQVEFCPMYRCNVHAFNDANCPRNAALDRFLKSWLPKTRNIFIRDYFVMTSVGAARAMPTSLFTLQQDLLYFREQKLLGAVPEMHPDGPNAANVPAGEKYAAWLLPPSRYTEIWDAGWPIYSGMTRLMWHPEQDLSKLIRQMCDSYYGPAGALMAQYHERLQRNWYQSGRIGQAPAADQIAKFGENVTSGPWCLGWSYAPRITSQAQHLLDAQPGRKNAREEITALAKILLDAREIARQKQLPIARDRIETDVALFQTWALSQGFEIDFLQGKTEVKLMATGLELRG
jgi:hypothetical protein